MPNTITGIGGHWWGLRLTQSSTPTNMLNVKDYSAKGDGVTNDSAAVATAMAAAIAAGKTLWFPDGTYLANLTLSDGANFLGASDWAWIKGKVLVGDDNTLTNLMLGIDGGYFGRRWGWDAAGTCDNLQCYRCTFVGGLAGDAGCPVTFQKVQALNHLFENCLFSRPTVVKDSVGYFTNGTVNDEMAFLTFHDCVWGTEAGGGSTRMNLELASDDIGGWVKPPHDVLLDGCTLWGSDDQSISFASQGGVGGVYPAYNLTVKDTVVKDANVATAVGVAAIELAGRCINVHLQRVTVQGSNVRYMLGQWTPADEVWDTQGNLIEDCTFDGRLSAQSAVSLRAANWTLKNSTVYTRSSLGTWIYLAADALLQNNDLYAWGASDIGTNHAVEIDNADSITFDANDIYSKSATAPVSCQDTGVSPAAATTNIAFTGNTFHRLTGAANVRADAGYDFDESGSTVEVIS